MTQIKLNPLERRLPELMDAKNVTILVIFSHGLGDVVQFSVILKHLAKYRPNWAVDVVCGKGKHTALIGLCRNVYSSEPDGHYDSRLSVSFFENFCRYPDRPNSKIVNCLQEVFGIQYDPSLGRYHCTVSMTHMEKAAAYLKSIGCRVVDGS